MLGVARVAALIGVGLLSALVVRAVSRGEPTGAWLVALLIVAPLAGVLHWLESWLAHDMAYRLLADMRMRFFRKLVELGPAYLASRRTGDLLGVATHDIELIEYFFAHTITPGLVAVLVPAVVLATLATFGWPMALAVLPFLAYAALSPVLGRGRIDRLSARAREASGELNAHTVDSVQGLGEIVAFQQEAQRGEALAARALAYAGARMPFLADLARQSALQDVATGLGGLAVTLVGAWLVAAGRLEGAMLPLLTLLAMSAFVPVWEIAQVGRQLADTLAATRRVHAVHGEPVRIADGPGVPGPRREEAAAIALHGVTFTYPGRRQPALQDVSFTVPAGAMVALVGPSGAGKTTIASLLLRFWDPDSGAITLGGHDLRRWRLEGLRREIALVAQDTHLFNDTLGGNIRIARPEATAAEVDGRDRARLAAAAGALAARGARHAGRRAGAPALGRPAPAGGHRAGLPAGGAGPDPGRGHVASRRGQRAGGAGGPRRPHPLAHHHRDRPPPLHRPRRRPDRGAGRGPRGRAGPPRRSPAPAGPLRPAGLPPGRRRHRLLTFSSPLSTIGGDGSS